MPHASTCSDCFHHGDEPNRHPGHADCRALPPTVSRQGPNGLLLAVYPMTAHDLPACGMFRSREGAVETKVATELETQTPPPLEPIPAPETPTPPPLDRPTSPPLETKPSPRGNRPRR